MSELPDGPFDWPIYGPGDALVGWVRVEEGDTSEIIIQKAQKLVDEYEQLEGQWNL